MGEGNYGNQVDFLRCSKVYLKRNVCTSTLSLVSLLLPSGWGSRFRRRIEEDFGEGEDWRYLFGGISRKEMGVPIQCRWRIHLSPSDVLVSGEVYGNRNCPDADGRVTVRWTSAPSGGRRETQGTGRDKGKNGVVVTRNQLFLEGYEDLWRTGVNSVLFETG